MNRMKMVFTPLLLGVMLFSLGGETVIPSSIAEKQVDKTSIETTITGHVTLEEFLNICTDEENEAEPESKSAQHVVKLKKKTKKSKKSKKKKKKSKTQYVYVSEYGTKYHKSKKCSNMKYVWRVTLKEAKLSGRGKCKKCW